MHIFMLCANLLQNTQLFELEYVLVLRFDAAHIYYGG